MSHFTIKGTESPVMPLKTQEVMKWNTNSIILSSICVTMVISFPLSSFHYSHL